MNDELTIQISPDLRQDLRRVAAAMGIASVEDAALVGLMEWVAKKVGEIEDKDPQRRYFVNEALDELIGSKKS